MRTLLRNNFIISWFYIILNIYNLWFIVFYRTTKKNFRNKHWKCSMNRTWNAVHGIFRFIKHELAFIWTFESFFTGRKIFDNRPHANQKFVPLIDSGKSDFYAILMHFYRVGENTSNWVAVISFGKRYSHENCVCSILKLKI